MEAYNLYNSPFLDFKSPFTTWEALKMVLLILLVPFRVVAIILIISVIALINSLALIGWQDDRPLPVARRRIVECSSQLCILILWCMGFHVRIKGWENVAAAKKMKAVGIFNHVSYMDTLVLFWLFLPSGVSKRGNSKIPLVGSCIRCLNNIYVDDTARAVRTAPASKARTASPDRNGPGDLIKSQAALTTDATKPSRQPKFDVLAHSADQSSGRLAVAVAAGDAAARPAATTASRAVGFSVATAIQQRLTDPQYLVPGGYPMLFIAPEGTVTNGQNLIKFRNGAFVSGQPVLPVLLRYPFKHLNPAYSEMETGFHVLRLMCQWVNFLEVTILPPYKPSADEIADATLYASNVRSMMAAQLGVPLVEQEYAHCYAMRKKHIYVRWNGRDIHGPKDDIDASGNILLELPAKRST